MPSNYIWFGDNKCEQIATGIAEICLALPIARAEHDQAVSATRASLGRMDSHYIFRGVLFRDRLYLLV
jgi:hypothetical protein